MKLKVILVPTLLIGITGGVLLTGCTERKQSGIAEVSTLQKDTVVYLQEGKSTPSCKINMDIAYLKPASEKDSISMLINSEIQREVFGERYAELNPEQCVSELAQDFIKGYNTDVKKLFEADVYNGMKTEDIPAWYNYEYQINSTLESGKDSSIWNYSIINFQYTGGAHPNTIAKYLNIEAQTGRILKVEDVFHEEATETICSLIMDKLIKEVNNRMETDTINTLEDLQSVGMLLDTDLYIPENFLLAKDGVIFYYNRYEIAPYSAGDFELEVPYDEINDYLK